MFYKKLKKFNLNKSRKKNNLKNMYLYISLTIII